MSYIIPSLMSYILCILCIVMYCINFGILVIALESIYEVDHLDLINFYTQLFLF